MKRTIALLLVFLLSCAALAEDTLPQIDNSTARIPITDAIYQYFTEQGYTGPEPICSKTHGAWLNLASGAADIIFLIAPTEDELQAFTEAGIDIDMKVYGYDGLVFLGNASNPVKSLTEADIRAIYSGAVTNWYYFQDGENADILVYVRNPESGSQRLFENLVWSGYEMPDFQALGFSEKEVKAGQPHKATVSMDMGDTVLKVMQAQYSIGFNIMSYVDNVFLSSEAPQRTVVARHEVPLRREADKNSEQRATIPKGTVLEYEGMTVLDKRGVEWYEVVYEDKYGFVSSRLTDLNVDNKSLKLFAINGYEPTTENFANGNYPYVTTSYVAIRADELQDSPARRLFDWVGSEESQRIIEENSTLSVAFTDSVTVCTRENDLSRLDETASQLSERELSREELRGYTQAELETLWHAVYAHSGRHFTDAQQKMREYFEGTSWYQDEGRDYIEAASQFNEAQQTNLALLEEYLALLRKARANVQPRVLAFGRYDPIMEGDDVERMQLALMEFDPEFVVSEEKEGKFDHSTRNELAKYQEANGIEPTGKLDVTTRLMLLGPEM